MAWSLVKNNNKNYFDIEFKNGAIVKEDNNLSFAKHNLLCFGRAYKELIPTSYKQEGYIASYLEQRPIFSIAWIGYVEQTISDKTIEFIKSNFNFACNRDLNNKIINKSIKITDVLKTAEYELSISINIMEEDLILNF